MTRISKYGLWEDPYSDVIVPSGNITMKGVQTPAIGTDEYNVTQMMFPGEDYTFPGNFVYEHPIIPQKNFPEIIENEKKNRKLYKRENMKDLNIHSLTQGKTTDDIVNAKKRMFLDSVSGYANEAIQNEAMEEALNLATDRMLGYNIPIAQEGTEKKEPKEPKKLKSGDKIYFIDRDAFVPYDSVEYKPREYEIRSYSAPLFRRKNHGHYLAYDNDGNKIKIRKDLGDLLAEYENMPMPSYTGLREKPAYGSNAAFNSRPSINREAFFPNIIWTGEKEFSPDELKMIGNRIGLYDPSNRIQVERLSVPFAQGIRRLGDLPNVPTDNTDRYFFLRNNLGFETDNIGEVWPEEVGHPYVAQGDLRHKDISTGIWLTRGFDSRGYIPYSTLKNGVDEEGNPIIFAAVSTSKPVKKEVIKEIVKKPENESSEIEIPVDSTKKDVGDTLPPPPIVKKEEVSKQAKKEEKTNRAIRNKIRFHDGAEVNTQDDEDLAGRLASMLSPRQDVLQNGYNYNPNLKSNIVVGDNTYYFDNGIFNRRGNVRRSVRNSLAEQSNGAVTFNEDGSLNLPDGNMAIINDNGGKWDEQNQWFLGETILERGLPLANMLLKNRQIPVYGSEYAFGNTLGGRGTFAANASQPMNPQRIARNGCQIKRKF